MLSFIHDASLVHLILLGLCVSPTFAGNAGSSQGGNEEAAAYAYKYHLSCVGWVTPGRSFVWPQEWTQAGFARRRFPGIRDLCVGEVYGYQVLVNGQALNFCHCDSDGRVICEQGLASIESHCEENCRCAPMRMKHGSVWWEDVPTGKFGPGNLGSGQVRNTFQKSAAAMAKQDAPPAAPSMISGPPRPPSHQPPKTCGGSCTNIHRCPESCSCRAKPDPRSPLGRYLSNCLLRVPSRRRLGLGNETSNSNATAPELGDLEWASLPCPCNASYVSHSCCDSTTGMVSEAEALKLGVLSN